MRFKNNEATALTVLNHNRIGISVLPGRMWDSAIDYVAKTEDETDDFYELDIELIDETDVTFWGPIALATELVGDETEAQVIQIDKDTEQILIVNEGGFYVTLAFNPDTATTDFITIPDNYRFTMTCPKLIEKAREIYINFEDAIATGAVLYQMRGAQIVFEQITP